MGVVGGFVLAWVNGRLSWDLVYQGMSSTMRITAMVVFILIFLVLGTIFMGLATPTEDGAMGVVGGLALAWVNGRLSWDLVYQGMSSTMRITAMVVFILIGARVFSLVFQGVGGK